MARHKVTIQEALNKTYTLKANNNNTGCIINFSPTLAGYKVGLVVIELPHVIRNNGDIFINRPEELSNCQINPIKEPDWAEHLPERTKKKNPLKDEDGFEKLSNSIHNNR